MQVLPFGQFRFRSVRQLGEGGLGVVDEIEITQSNAPDKPVGTRWARKRLNAKWGNHPEIRERFEREIGALQTMKHPRIVTHEGENLPGEPRFYVMPVYENNLRKFVAGNSKRGDWRFVASHGAGLADALGYAHGCGFIHRDLKPENILYKSNGPLTIADWGLGYFVHRESKVLQHLTRGGLGTEYYCSLEQWATGKCDGRGDIYSLGMTLDELMTGRQRTIIAGQGLAQHLARGRRDGEGRLHDLLVRMTSVAPSARPNDMASVAAELRAALQMP